MCKKSLHYKLQTLEAASEGPYILSKGLYFPALQDKGWAEQGVNKMPLHVQGVLEKKFIFDVWH